MKALHVGLRRLQNPHRPSQRRWSTLSMTLHISECTSVLLDMLWRNLCSDSVWTSACRAGGTTEQAKRKLLGMQHWIEPFSRCAARHTDLTLAPFSFISALAWVLPRPHDSNLSETDLRDAFGKHHWGSGEIKHGRTKATPYALSRILCPTSGNQSAGNLSLEQA